MSIRNNEPLEKRLKDRIFIDSSKEDGCWIWTGSKNKKGYGHIEVGIKLKSAHRIMYELHVGVIPLNHDIHHKCNNPSCVRPTHLEAVTKARHVQLGKHTKLTDENVKLIRELASQKVPYKIISSIYKISEKTITDIVRFKTWKEL